MSENQFDNIDFCCDLLYDYMYNEKTSNEYDYRNVLLDDISLKDIKKTSSFDPTKVLSNVVKYSGKFNNKYIYTSKTASDKKYMIVIGKYDISNKDTTDMHRSELINMIVPYALCELGTEHIVAPIMNFDILYNELKKYPIIIEKLPNTFEDSTLYVNVLERFVPSSTLNNYVRNNLKALTLNNWVYIVFQLIYGLAVITRKYPQFVHGNLNTTSIYVFDTQNKKTHHYKLNDTHYKLDNNSIGVKLTHFEKTHLTDNYINKNEIKTTNPVHDLVTLMKDLYRLIDELKYDNNDVLELLESIIPKKYIGLDENVYLNEISNVPTPAYLLLNNRYFKPLIDNTSSETYVSDKNNFFLEFIQDNMGRRKQIKGGDDSSVEEPIVEIEDDDDDDEELEPTEENSDEKSVTEESDEKRGIAKKKKEKKEKKDDDDELEDDEDDEDDDDIEEAEKALSPTSSEESLDIPDEKKDDELSGGSLSLSDLSDSVKEVGKKGIEVVEKVVKKVGDAAEGALTGMRNLFGEFGQKGQPQMPGQMQQLTPQVNMSAMSELVPPQMSVMAPQMMQQPVMGMPQKQIDLPDGPAPANVIAEFGLPEKPTQQAVRQQAMGGIPPAFNVMNAMPAMVQGFPAPPMGMPQHVDMMMPPQAGGACKKYKLRNRSGF